jgi:hypothetical protein
MVFSKFLENPERLFLKIFGIHPKTGLWQNEPPPTSPNIAHAILGEAQDGAENVQRDLKMDFSKPTSVGAGRSQYDSLRL